MNKLIEPVIFRMGTYNEVFALFPTLAASPGHCTAYTHVGQHGAANYPHCIRTSRPATPTEYKPLLAELEKIGYRMRVYKRKPAHVCIL